MAGGISVHVVDITRGIPASGMKVEIFSLAGAQKKIAEGVLSADGVFEHPVTRGEGVTRGVYEAVFYVGDFYRGIGYELPAPPFLDIVPFRFGVGDVTQHYHLPLKVSPWGFSMYRGG